MTFPVPSSARVEAATERLYGLLPAHIRSVDARNGWVLKALLQVLASSSVELDHEIDVLYDSMFAETAPASALADLAALVASEPLRPLPAGSGHNQRAFIANTMRYRRGKGTARVLEALASDVGRFGAVAVEYFMRLSRTQDLLDVRAERSGTGWVVPGVTAARSGTGFDTLPRLLDVRSIARAGGRHHVPHVGVHLLRPRVPFYPAPVGTDLDAALLAAVPQARPWLDGASVVRPGYFQLAAQPGRMLRLFNPDRRSEGTSDRTSEVELPDRLRRLPLHLETDELRKATMEGRAANFSGPPWFDLEGQPFTIFMRNIGATKYTRVLPQEVLIANLDVYPTPAGARPPANINHSWFTAGASSARSNNATHAVRCGFDPATGRLIVASPVAGAADVEEVRVAYGTGMGRELGVGPHERNGVEVPFDITDTLDVQHFIRVVDRTVAPVGASSATLRTVNTLAVALDEWAVHGVGKRGLIVLVRCDHEAGQGALTVIPVSVHPDSELHIVSGEWRPKIVKPGVQDNPLRHGYVVRRYRRFNIDAPLRVVAASVPPASGRPGALVLDGLELTRGLLLGVRAVSRLHTRYCTLRAPTGDAVSTEAVLEGMAVEIVRSITGRVALELGAQLGRGKLSIQDSIVSADESPLPAISASGLDAELRATTIFGESSFKSLEATDVIFDGATKVVRNQTGCVRFCSIASGSRTPRRFRCQPDIALAAATEKKGAALGASEAETIALGVLPLFLDRSLDEPTVAMLHPLCSDAIRLGGEADAELGAFSAAAEGLRMANIISLFEDYLPFGLEAGLIDDTRSSDVAKRRNRP